MNLEALIEASGKSQAAVARTIGTRPQYMNAVIKGRRPLPLKWIEPLCRELLCDPNTLFGWEEAEFNYLPKAFRRLVVFDTDTEKEIAVVTDNEITTAGDNIVVKLTPR